MTRLIALVALLGACSSLPADPAPEYQTEAQGALAAPQPDLAVWAADERLAAAARVASGRIAATTGLLVVVTPNTRGAVPLFWTDLEGSPWLGFMHDDDGNGADYMTIDADVPADLFETVVLHEILHALGAMHVGTGEGVLSPEIWQRSPITAADLTEVCSVRDCLSFAPEAG